MSALADGRNPRFLVAHDARRIGGVFNDGTRVKDHKPAAYAPSETQIVCRDQHGGLLRVQ